MHRVKDFLAHVGLPGCSIASAAVSYSVHVESWLRIAGSLMAIASGAVAMYWVVRINSRKLEALECDECQKGLLPARCPLPRHRRPQTCPHREEPWAGA